MAHAEDIVEVAAKNPQLSTLVAALKAADLLKALKGPGPFTVFAPNNAAFDKLPKATLTALLRPENKAKLIAVLGYHVVPGGKFLASEVTQDSVGTPSPPTLEGNTIMLTSIKPFLINGVKVSTADIIADNGVIHIVEGVLLPPGVALPGGVTAGNSPRTTPDPVAVPKPDVPAAAKPTKTLTELVESDPELSILSTVLKGAKLDSVFQNSGPYTLLAPDNGAFAKLPADVVAALRKPGNGAKIVELLKYHALSGAFLSSSVEGTPPGGESPPTLQGTPLILSSINPLKINDSLVTRKDIEATNGVLHVVDAVLIPKGFVESLLGSTSPVKPAPPIVENTTPPATQLPVSDLDIIQVAKADPNLSTFVQVVEKAGLTRTLQRRGPFTVFAPDNAAFKKLKKADLEELTSPQGAPKLLAILTFHVSVGIKRAADLTDGQMLKTTNSDGQLKISVGSGIKAGNANIIKADIPAKNGVIHIVDAIIMPPKEALPKPVGNFYDN